MAYVKNPAWVDGLLGGTLITAAKLNNIEDGLAGAALVADTVSAGKVDKGTLVVNVKDHGATGDGLTDDGTAVTAAITAASSTGSILHWPAGTYAVTASIANLHTVRHTGPGVIARSGLTFYVDPQGSQTSRIHVSPSGSDANDGLTPALPRQTFQAAFDAIANYGRPVLSGAWEVIAAAGTYPIAGSEAVHETPSVNRVVIKGPAVTSPTVPTAILDGAGGLAYEHGIRIGGSGVMAEVRDLKFINFTAGGPDTTRISVVCENGADLLAINVHATGATWCGIYGFAGERLRVAGGIFDGCRSGVIVNDMQATVGAAGAAGAVTIRNSTEGGLYWSRGAQGHADYILFEDNAIGLLVRENSRVDTVANTFNRNIVGIRTGTGGVWGEGGDPNVYGTGADANTTLFDNAAFSGNSIELQTSHSYSRFAYDRTTRNVTGTTTLTTLTTAATLPARRLQGVGKSCRVHVQGVYTVTAGSTLTVTFGGMSWTATVPAAATNAVFEIDVTLHDVAGGYRALGRLQHTLASARMATASSGFDSTVANAVTVAATPANVADSITVYRTDVYVIG